MFKINNKEARLIVLQRIELISNFLKKIRKIFGRYLFSNFISKYFLSNKNIGKAYFEDMHQEFESINSAIEPYNKNLLSIGGGLGGLELVINKKETNSMAMKTEILKSSIAATEQLPPSQKGNQVYMDNKQVTGGTTVNNSKTFASNQRVESTDRATKELNAVYGYASA